MVDFIKNNVLLIALLAIVIYQQFLLNELLYMAHRNDSTIVETHNRVGSVEIEVEALRSELGDISHDIQTLPLRITP